MFDEATVENESSFDGPFREVMNHWYDLSEAERKAFANRMNTEEDIANHPEARMHRGDGFDFTLGWMVEGDSRVLPLRRRTVGELAWHITEQIIAEVKTTGDWLADTVVVLLPPDAPIPGCDGLATPWHHGSEAYHVGLTLITTTGEHKGRSVRRKRYDGSVRDEPLYTRAISGYEVVTVKTYHRKVMAKLMTQGIDDWGGNSSSFDQWLESNRPIVADTIDIPGATYSASGGVWSIDIYGAMEETM